MAHQLLWKPVHPACSTTVVLTQAPTHLMNKLVLSVPALATGLLFALAALAAAQVSLLFDGSLPVVNLNNTATICRSKLVCADSRPASLITEDLTQAGHGNFTLTTIRVWSSDQSDMMLWGDPVVKSTAPVSNPTVTGILHAEDESFHGYDLGFSRLHHPDLAAGLSVRSGKPYDFFLDNPFVSPFLHSSKPALIGSLQSGADNLFLFPEPEASSYRRSSINNLGRRR